MLRDCLVVGQVDMLFQIDSGHGWGDFQEFVDYTPDQHPEKEAVVLGVHRYW